MQPHLVKLPDGTWVNPHHVTAIECKTYPGSQQTCVWVKKDAGYGTGSFNFAGDRRNELAAIINQ